MHSSRTRFAGRLNSGVSALCPLVFAVSGSAWQLEAVVTLNLAARVRLGVPATSRQIARDCAFLLATLDSAATVSQFVASSGAL
jgi:hypothetical protein